MTNPVGGRSPIHQVRWMTCYNASGEEVPSHAIMKISSFGIINGAPLVNADKPDATDDDNYAINGATPIPAGGYGECCINENPSLILFGEAGVTVGAEYGPVVGQWYLSASGSGFIAYSARMFVPSGLAIFAIKTDKEGTGSATVSVKWGRTQANWSNSGGDPLVSVKEVSGTPGRTSATVTGAAFSVYLPRDGTGQDPNVVSGVNIPYSEDEDGNFVCAADYLDAKIGSVRLWSGTIADIPSGWGLMDGATNSIGNGGYGVAMSSGADRFFARGTHLDAEVGNSGGSDTATINPHTGAQVAAVLDDHDCSAIDAHAAKNTNPSLTGISVDAHTGYSTGQRLTGITVDPHSGSTTDLALTSITIGDHAADVTGPDGGHTHTGTTQTGGSHSHSGDTGPGGSHNHGGVTDAASGTTDTGYANIDDPGHDHGEYTGSVDAGEDGTDQAFAAGDTASSTTGITDTGHTHGFGSHTHTITNESTHTHSISLDFGHPHFINSGDLNTALDHTHTTPLLAHNITDPKHQHGFSTLTHTVNETSHDHTIPSLTHSVNDAGHYHNISQYTHSGTLTHTGSGNLTHDQISTIPKYKYLMFIERLDNSA